MTYFLHFQHIFSAMTACSWRVNNKPVITGYSRIDTSPQAVWQLSPVNVFIIDFYHQLALPLTTTNEYKFNASSSHFYK